MKTIGLLGGTSWPSTIQYYEMLNRLAQEKFGPDHSASILLKSIDYYPIKSRYGKAWAEIPALLRREIEALAALKPDCILLCNNTLHKALDTFLPELRLPMPLFHMVELTAKHLRQHKQKNILLLGTKFTMEDGYYAAKLAADGADVTIPQPEEREQVQQAQTRLARNEILESDRAFFHTLLTRYRHLDAAVLACTELPLAMRQQESPLALVNPSEVQCMEAFNFATREDVRVSGHAA